MPKRPLYCAAGDVHGALDRLYADVLAFEAALGETFDHVLHVGDFGIWPDPDRLDRATRAHEGAGDFPRWFATQTPAPRPTVFIAGNHEDFEFLHALRGDEVLPGLRYLRSGDVTVLDGDVRVGGIGGCYGPSDYERPTRTLEGGARRHYTREQAEGVTRHGRIDVLLLHDAPAGTRFTKRLPSGAFQSYVSAGAGLGDAVARTRPKACFFGHHHQRLDTEVAGVRCVGLNAGGRPGNLVAFSLDADGSAIVGEWPGTP